jgi:LmbE family N-acetylglucosaminyl deacetylase
MDIVNRRIIPGRGTPERQWRRHRALAQLPQLSASELVPPGSRAVIVAPHPDDEVLGCGGLMAQLALLPREVLLIAASDGENSHAPGSAWTPALLGQVRPAETAAALACLGMRRIAVLRAGLPDGGVARHRTRLEAMLRAHLRPSDVLFASWRLDGHPDHETVGMAAASAARATGCSLLEMPIWAWNWSAPGDGNIAWRRARKLLLDDAALIKKSAAIRCYRSQIEADASTGNPAVLQQRDLAHFRRRYEVFFL